MSLKALQRFRFAYIKGFRFDIYLFYKISSYQNSQLPFDFCFQSKMSSIQFYLTFAFLLLVSSRFCTAQNSYGENEVDHNLTHDQNFIREQNHTDVQNITHSPHNNSHPNVTAFAVSPHSSVYFAINTTGHGHVSVLLGYFSITAYPSVDVLFYRNGNIL